MAEIKRSMKVGSRKSQLALIQTKFIIGEVKKLFPEYSFEIVTLDTLGDKVLDKALPKIGEKALFTKELEDALLDGSGTSSEITCLQSKTVLFHNIIGRLILSSIERVDFVVHSLKDLPTTLPEGLGIGTICRRDNKYDAIILHKKHHGHTLETLPPGSVIGTSSLRRIAQLARRYPHLKYENVRGNLNTRLRKLDEDNKYDALVLAVAGIHRMNWHERISQILTPPSCLYAVGQGALAVEVRNNDKETLDVLSKLTHLQTLICCAAERAYLRRLDGGCSAPVGISAEWQDNKLKLEGAVLSLDGGQCITDEVCHTVEQNTSENDDMEYLSDISTTCVIIPEYLKHALQCSENSGIELANMLLNRGAGEVIKIAKEMIEKS